MKTTLASALVLVLLMGVGACASQQSAETSPAKNAAASAPPASVTLSPEQLLQGRWVAEAEDGFEPWVYFDGNKVYGDGNEAGMPYDITGEQIVYHAEYGDMRNQIVELTATRFVEEAEGGFRTVWTKADLYGND